MIVHPCKQNTPEWHELRLGIPTASVFDKIVTPKKCELSSQAEGLMHWLLAEWMIGAPLESPQTKFMQNGSDLEPFAVESYEFETDRSVQEVGFITTDDRMIGASPDRLVGDDGLLEIKAPAIQTHVGYLLKRGVDQDYRCQLQGQLWIAERKWVDIQSYSPGLPSVIIRVERDEDYIAKLSAAVRCFVDVMLKARVQLEQVYGSFKPRVKPRPAEPMGVTEEDLDLILAARRAMG